MDTPTPSTPLLLRRMDSIAGHKLLWRTGATFVAFGMIVGAFGAHALKKKPGITPEKVHAWGTATSYAIYNGLGLLAISLNPRFASHRFAGPAIACGGFLFSGTILALVLAGDRLKVLGAITPLGGMVMVAGYLSLAV